MLTYKILATRPHVSLLNFVTLRFHIGQLLLCALPTNNFFKSYTRTPSYCSHKIRNETIKASATVVVPLNVSLINSWPCSLTQSVSGRALGDGRHLRFEIVTFCVSRRRRKMYCGHARLCPCVCVCVCPRPHAHTTARTMM